MARSKLIDRASACRSSTRTKAEREVIATDARRQRGQLKARAANPAIQPGCEFRESALPAAARGADHSGCTTPPAYRNRQLRAHPRRSKIETTRPKQATRVDSERVDKPWGES